MIQAIAIIKFAAARANFELKLLAQDSYFAIRQAIQEIIRGKFADSFPRCLPNRLRNIDKYEFK